jgi:NADH-quinone oxidoreductase subunit M
VAAAAEPFLNWTTSPALPNALVALPVLGALALLILPRLSEKTARVFGLVASFSTLALLAAAVLSPGTVDTVDVVDSVDTVDKASAATLPATTTSAPAAALSPAVASVSTASTLSTASTAAALAPALASAPVLDIAFTLRLSGLSLLLVLLTGIIAPMSLLASWKLPRPRLFNALFLLTQSAVLGVFLAQNFFFWFLFWELSLFPAFFLIKLWGGPGAGRAAFQFVIYTVGGSAFMLLAFAAIFAATGTWDFAALTAKLAAPGVAGAAPALNGTAATLVFLGILAGLAVKVPMFPFHTWLPDTYAEAPTGVAMFLTAVMAKMGLYGFYIFLVRMFPAQLHDAAPWLSGLALAGVVLSAYAALRQTDMKRMVAYSSVNHLGYCLLAFIAAAGATAGAAAGAAPVATARAVAAATDGAFLQMFNHGLSAAALFFCAGVFADRSGSRSIGDFGGVRKVAPLFAALCGFSVFSSLGLPGLNGFPGEFMIFRGVFALAPWTAAAATLGLLGTALFLLTFWQKVFHGPPGTHTAAVTDLTRREKLTLAPVVALMVLFGVWPQALLNILKTLPTW